MMRPPARSSPGFTMVEMVIAMVVMGVLAGAVAMLLRPALDTFTSGRQRQRLVADADQAVRRMVRDVQSAVPNSLRSPSASCFELVPTVTGGRYRMGPNNPAGSSQWVDTTASTTSFDVLTSLSAMPQVNDWVVVDNQNPGDVYGGTNRSQITAITTPATPSDGRHRIGINALQFPLGYDGGRFAVVPDAQQAVFYVCSGASSTLDGSGNAPGTLVRLKRYGFNATAPVGCPATTGGDLLATHVRSCRFLYDPNQGATQQSGFLSIQLELTRNHETASLTVGAHVANSP